MSDWQQYDGRGGFPPRTRNRFADLRLADLRRSTTDRKLFGVCGGIAEWLGVSSLAVRLATMASMFIVGPFTIGAYILLAVLVDNDAKRPTGKEAYGGAETIDIRVNVGGRDSGPRDSGRRPGEMIGPLMRRFGLIEERMRKVEAEVTSTSFRINRELRS
jgi:phage shock protein PspC (stress-responsive transcriptional regulator)